MDGENDGKPLFFNGWFGGKTHYFWKHPNRQWFQFSPLVYPGDDMTSSKVPDAPPMALLLAIEGCKRQAAFHLSQLESDL